MEIVIFVILFIIAVAYLPATFLFARPMMRRGYVGWGFLTGLGVLVIAFFLSKYSLIVGQYQSFSKDGPCSTCFERVDISLILLQIGWGIGASLSVIHNLTYGIDLYKREPKRLMRWPKALGFWSLGIILVSWAFLIIKNVVQNHHYKQVIQQISSVDTQITNKISLTEIGEYPIVQPYLLPTTTLFGSRTLLKFSSNGKWLFLSLASHLEVWDARSLEKIYQIKGDSYRSREFTVSPDSSQVALLDGDTLAMYEVATGMVIWEKSVNLRHAYAVRFSSVGSQIVLVDYQNLIRLDTKTGDVILNVEISDNQDSGYFIVYQDGSFLIGKNKAIVSFFDGFTGKLIHSTTTHQALEEDVSGILDFLPNNLLVYWSDKANDYWIYTWNTDGNLTQTVQVDRDPPRIYAFSPNSDFIFYSSSHGRNSYVMNIRGEIQQEIKLDSAITAATFSPDNRFLVIATADGYLRFFAQDSAE